MSDEPGVVRPPLTPNLELAREWAIELGNTTEHISATGPDGKVEPAISIQHGMFVIFCKEQGEALLLIAVAEVPPVTRARLRTLDEPIRQKLLTSLKLAVMQNERTGFNLLPVDLTSIEQLQKYSLSQTVRIARDSPETYNRFGDAIQEISSGLLRSLMAFGPLMAPQTNRVSDPMYR
jgi:hypothetical protein